MGSRRPDFYSRFNRKARALWFRYLRWQTAHLSQSVALILVALIIGILTGAAAAVLKLLVRFFSNLLLNGVKFQHPDIRFLIWPLAGILITSIFTRYVARQNITTGTRLIKRHLINKNYHLGIFDIFNPIIGCSLTMGFGATAGTEGPTALSGASIGSCVGRWFKFSRAWQRLLFGIGAGAGIAAIFKSPMGGALFTLEVLQMEMITLPVIALIIACLFASSTAYLLSDFTFDISFFKDMPMQPHTLGWVALLGIFCGIYSIYYNFTKNRGAKLFEKIKNPWLGAIVTGSTLSLFVFIFPVLFGEGFDVITRLVNGQYVSFTDSGIFAGHTGMFWLVGSISAVLLLKGFLVAASYSNGGIAGDFVPTFFAGALAGTLFAITVNHFFRTELPVWYFALIGMGCVMAGTIHAPLMAIFLTCETTNTYAYIFPYILGIALSYATVKIITPKAWYSETGSDDIQDLMARRETPDLISKVGKRSKKNSETLQSHSLNTSNKKIPDQK